MHKVKGKGLLRHQFWGAYSATIALAFNSENAASDAVKVLGKEWVIANQNSSVLLWTGNSEELNNLKDVLARYGADRDKIDSIKRSIDYGEEFYVEIPVICVEQLSLL